MAAVLIKAAVPDETALIGVQRKRRFTHFKAEARTEVAREPFGKARDHVRVLDQVVDQQHMGDLDNAAPLFAGFRERQVHLRGLVRRWTYNHMRTGKKIPDRHRPLSAPDDAGTGASRLTCQ